MGRWPFLLSLSFLLAGIFSPPAVADKRVALVVGNGTYRNVARLDNPANDAKLLADTLRDLGFVLVGGDAQLDLDKASFDRAVQDFGAQLQGADVGLFFYAGHGVQVRGTNYLIPVDANPTREADVDFQMLDTNLVMRQMEGAGTRLNLVILDACRNNPFSGRGLVVGRGRDTESVRLRDASSGLAQMQAPEGTLVSFATQPGSVARDGIDGHSPYSKALAETIRRPGLGIFDAFNQVGLEVKRATGGAQQPWVSSSPLDGAFYFVPPDAAGPQVAALPPSPPTAPRAPAGAVVPAITTSEVRRFDGIWAVDIACKQVAAADAVNRQIFAMIKDGLVRGQVGQPDSPGWLTYDGTIDADGTILVFAKGISARSSRPPSSKFSYIMSGRLEGARGTASRDDRPDCNIKLAKQPAGAGSTVAAHSAEPDVQRSAALGAPQMPAAASDVRRFDGTWLGSYTCPPAKGVGGFRLEFIADVKDGVFHGQFGEVGKPSSHTYDGKIKPDGTALITSNFLTGDPNVTGGHPPIGTPGSHLVTAKFEESSGTGTQLAIGRICNYSFAKN
jgi:uncharacterized caspase-like protein